MKSLRHFGPLVLFALANALPAADHLAPEERLASVRLVVEQGKLAHAIRGVEMLIANYPSDPRLPALKAQLTSLMLREMPPQNTVAAAVGASTSAPRPPVPTERRAIAGRSFVAGTANLAMIWIPPGTFFMETVQHSDDGTLVTLSRGYWLGQTEVTQEQWQPLMPDDPLPSHFKGSDRPIEWISWSSAMDFCHKLTERERAGGRLPEGYEYTLPTEAQWEYACRAGTTGSFAGDLDAMAWYEKNSGLQTHPVGQKQPNAWGLYDMHGNVWEWCLDVYAGYPGGQVTDPRPDNTGPNASAPRMVRGGSAGASAGQCRSAERYRNGISYTSAAVGFRVALVPEFVASATREPAGGKANNRP